MWYKYNNKIDYERLKYIRNSSKSVEIMIDKETGEKTVYHSTYSAGKAYRVNAKAISNYNGKIWRNDMKFT